MNSASALDRLSECPPSAFLTPRVDESGEQAERGNFLHEFCRRVANDPSQRESALECVPLEWQKTAAYLDFDTALAGLTVRATEEAYAVDAATGEVTYLGNNIARHYEEQCQKLYGRSLRPTEVCCSLDVDAVAEDGNPCALDWKSGVSNKPAGEMWQMILQCYILSVKYNSYEAHARVAYIAPDGSVSLDTHTFNRMELDEVPAKLMAILDAIKGARTLYESGTLPTLSPGDWCKYCPHLRACKAQTSLVHAAIGDLTTVASDAIMMTPEQIGQAYGKLKQIESLAEKVRDALKAMMEQNGGAVPAGPGYEYRMDQAGRTYLPHDLVRGLLTKYEVPLEEINSITKISRYPVIRRVKVKK